MIQELNTALQAMKKQTNRRIEVYDQWSGEKCTHHIDQIRLETKSGNVTGFSGEQRVFDMTLQEFSKYAETGKVTTYYVIDHCPIERRYRRVD